jgi:HEPN domain-containing protein
MVDIEKQIAHWKTSGEEDWAAAQRLLEGGMIRHGLYFSHLALEKLLKGLVCRQTRDLPPRIHNLVSLLELAGLAAEADDLMAQSLAQMNAFQMEGRYPDFVAPPVTPSDAIRYRMKAEEAYRWLLSRY